VWYFYGATLTALLVRKYILLTLHKTSITDITSL
jgi:hypothetical protein